MKQSLVKTVTVAILVAGLSAFSESKSVFDLDEFFSGNIGLSQEEIVSIRGGKPVAKALKSRIADEIFVFGAIYINADPGKYLVFAKDIERLRKLSGYLAIGNLKNPPQPSDLQGFTFDGEDLKALKECKPGDCMIQMPASGIELVNKSISWSDPNAGQRVNQLLQQGALRLVDAYKKRGNIALGEYNDHKHPAKVPEQFQYMISYSKAIPAYLPAFYNYLLSFPNRKPANVEDSFKWEKVDFGLKPTLRLVHVVIMRGNSPTEPYYVVAEKQLYSSHYFRTALDLSFCLRDSKNPQKPGFILVKAMGSEQAGLTGFKGSIVRKVAMDRSVDSLEKSLAVIKSTLEGR
jgi:hypothetical protein